MWDGADEMGEFIDHVMADWDPKNVVDNVKRPPITTKSFSQYYNEVWGPAACFTRFGGGRYGNFPLGELFKGMGYTRDQHGNLIGKDGQRAEVASSGIPKVPEERIREIIPLMRFKDMDREGTRTPAGGAVGSARQST